MFIILSIYSKNLNSLTNFLKFFYKFKTNKFLKLNFSPVQSQKKKKFFFLSVLKSPHVNKKSQEQFEYYIYTKQLKIHVFQIAKFLTIWKILKIKLFSDVKIKTKFCLYHKQFKPALFCKTDYDRFVLKFFQKNELTFLKLNKLTRAKRLALKQSFFSNKTGAVFLKLLDTHGEILLKNSTFMAVNQFKNKESVGKSLDSSVGRAKDWKSLWRQFDPVSKHIQNFLWKILYEI